MRSLTAMTVKKNEMRITSLHELDVCRCAAKATPTCVAS